LLMYTVSGIHAEIGPSTSAVAATSSSRNFDYKTVSDSKVIRAGGEGQLEKEVDYAQRLQASFIWTKAEPPQKQTYAAFRKTFEIENVPAKAALRIFADNRYLLWINKAYVERGPCRFDPKRPEYDILDVTDCLQKGKNVITVLVHYYAVGSFKACQLQCSRMMEHRPGLTVELEIVLPGGKEMHQRTDATWRWTTETRFQPSPGTYTSVPDNIDARRDTGDWMAVDFNDSSWRPAVPIEGGLWGQLQPRNIPLLQEENVKSLVLVSAKPATIETGPAQNLLPIELGDGAELIFDCGRVVQGYSVLDFDASDGSRLEISYATRFFDSGRIPNAGYMADHQPNRYTARAGRQTYMSTDTFGCKYVVIRVIEGLVKLHGLRIIDRRYPFQRLGRFASHDKILERIWDISVRTIECCSEDAHVDCADRERAQWMADGYMMGYPVSRVALAGPGQDGKLCFADSRLLVNMLRHVAYSQLPDGRLQPMRPSQYPVQGKHGVIDDYSCLWVQAVAELYRRDGDLALVSEVWPVLVKAIDYYLQRVTKRGLVHASEFVYFRNPLAYVACEGATINAYIYRALLDSAELARALGETMSASSFTSAAEHLREAYNRQLWDEQAGSYHGAIIETNLPVAKDNPPTYSEPYSGPVDSKGLTPPTGHAALLALYFDLVPAERKTRVFEFMLKQFPAENAFPYTYAFFLKTLYKHDTEEMDKAALKTIRDYWRHMTSYETGTTSEGWRSSSFVHESGAHPAYFLSSYVLGVRTEGPREARQLVIDPRLGELDYAEGTTLTEFGPVEVLWQRDEKQMLTFEVDNKTTIPATVSLRLPEASMSLVIDGKPLLHNGLPATNSTHVHNGRVYFSLPSGKHLGYLSRTAHDH